MLLEYYMWLEKEIIMVFFKEFEFYFYMKVWAGGGGDLWFMNKRVLLSNFLERWFRVFVVISYVFVIEIVFIYIFSY